MERIVLFRSGALGDCIVSIPTLRLLRKAYPNAHVALIGRPYSGTLFEGARYWNDLHLLDYRPQPLPYFSKLLALRKNRYDASIDFHSTGRTRGQTALIGATKRVAFDVKGIPDRYLYTDLVPNNRTIHAADRIANLLLPLGIEHSASDLLPSVEIGGKYRAEAAFILRQHEVLKPFVVFQCSCGKRPANRHWPAERFATVADWLWEQGIQVVVTSAREDPEVQEVISAAKFSITNLSGTTEPLVLAAILEQAQLYLGYNTGPMHLAAAVGTPVIALYDLPNDIVEWAPLGQAPVRLVKAEAGINSISSSDLISETGRFLSDLETATGNLGRLAKAK